MFEAVKVPLHTLKSVCLSASDYPLHAYLWQGAEGAGWLVTLAKCIYHVQIWIYIELILLIVGFPSENSVSIF